MRTTGVALPLAWPSVRRFEYRLRQAATKTFSAHSGVKTPWFESSFASVHCQARKPIVRRSGP